MPSSPSFAIFGLTLSGVATSVLSTALSTAQSTAGDGRDRKEGADAEAAAPAGLREALLSALVWPATLTVPLVLHRREVYTRLLPRRLYEEPVELGGAQLRPPLGLALGIGAVVVGQVATIAYHYARRARLLGTPTAVQVRRRARPRGWLVCARPSLTWFSDRRRRARAATSLRRGWASARSGSPSPPCPRVGRPLTSALLRTATWPIRRGC